METAKRIAILIPAHNEDSVIQETLVHAVMENYKNNVYLVADNCTDDTVNIASKILNKNNILEVERMGKGPALNKALDHFKLLDRYDGIFFLDADSLVLEGTMNAFRRSLQRGVAAVIGHMKVLSNQNSVFASWRRYQYFMGFNLNIRASDFYRGCFPNTPGCCTVFSTDALRKVEYDNNNPAEDMDFCFQIHRKKLGRIKWQELAWVETSDPLNLKDYAKQLVRWGRGWWYNVRKHKVGIKFMPVDFLAGYYTFMMFFNWLRILTLFVLGVLFLMGVETPLLDIVVYSFILDVFILTFIGLIAASRRSFKIITHIPLFLPMMMIDLCIYGYAFATHRKELSAMWTSPKR